MLNCLQEMLLNVSLKEPLVIGDTPLGQRQFYGVKSGQITGHRLRAKVIGGGEWALICPDGYLRVDVRLQARTEDGDVLYVQYNGVLELNKKVMDALAQGQATEFEDQHFYVNPRFETGSETHSWLNAGFFVGEGRVTENLGVEYRIYAISS